MKHRARRFTCTILAALILFAALPVLSIGVSAETSPVFDDCFGGTDLTYDSYTYGAINEQGYEFSGWYADGDYTADPIYTAEAAQAGTVYAAKWENHGSVVIIGAVDLSDGAVPALPPQCGLSCSGTGLVGDPYTVTLKNTTIDAKNAEAVLKLHAGTVLVLEGTNTLVGSAAALCGIRCNGRLEIRGSGSLTVKVSGTDSAKGISTSGALAVHDAVLSIRSVGPDSTAIRSEKGMELNGAVVSAEAVSCGIRAFEGITAAGGRITAKATGAGSEGIHADGLSISDHAVVNAEGVQQGVYAERLLSVENSVLKLSSLLLNDTEAEFVLPEGAVLQSDGVVKTNHPDGFGNDSELFMTLENAAEPYAAGQTELTPQPGATLKLYLRSYSVLLGDSLVKTTGYLTRPADPQKQGCAFVGWFLKDASLHAWDFETEYVRDTGTISARFTETENAAGLRGTVKDHTGTPVTDAYVRLLRGTDCYAAAAVDTAGCFDFGKVEKGSYDLSVVSAAGTVYDLIEVDGDRNLTVLLPEYASYSMSGDLAGVTVDGLKAAAEALPEAAYMPAELKLQLNSAAEDEWDSAQNAVRALEVGRLVEFISVGLQKNIGVTSNLKSVGSVLTVVLPWENRIFDAVGIYRLNGSEPKLLTELKSPSAEAENGQYAVDRVNGVIYLYLTEPGTYAVSYIYADEHSDEVMVEHNVNVRINSFAVEIEAAAGGSVTASAMAAPKGETVSITVVPEEGMQLKKLSAKDRYGLSVSFEKMKDGSFSFTMPSGGVKISAEFERVYNVPKFADVSSDAYYYDAVVWAYNHNVLTGEDENSFAPDKATTRAQFVTFLWRAAGSPISKVDEYTAYHFEDVKAGSYYYDAVIWALANGITKGVDAAHFAPDAEVDRAQAVTFLARADGVTDEETGFRHSFADVTRDDYFCNAVAWAEENGITAGLTDTEFAPDAECIRAQAITFLFRARA